MAKKIKQTRPELKRHRDALARFTRYLPMLKLKQQQLQLTLRDLTQRRREAIAEAQAARERIDPYRAVLQDMAGLNVEKLAEPEEVKTHRANVAGVWIPVFDSVSFPEPNYSLFGTPPWVDRALMDLRSLSERREKAQVLDRQHELLSAALTKITQRVNLFEKVLIPDAQEAIRLIRIRLGEEQTAAVGRAKLAKAKLAEQAQAVLEITVPNGQEAPA